MKKYHIIYSLGTDCACAMYMKQHNLRQYSGPFDWLTHATFETRAKLIINDFDKFLEIDDLRPIAKDINVENDDHCDYYENIRSGFYYYHDFPVGKTLKDVFNDVHTKYQRRICRFYDNVSKSKKVLFIWFSHEETLSDSFILDRCDLICKKFEKIIDFAIIQHDPNSPKGTIQSKLIAPNIQRYYLFSQAKDSLNRPTTQGDIDTCSKIFAQYQRIIPFRKRFLKRALRILCIVIPQRNLRKRLRNLIKL